MSKNRILLVEDDYNSAKLLSDSLESQGLAIDHVKDGVSAINLVEETPYDIILLDLRLPGQNGFITAQKIRELKKSRSIPIIVTTAFADPQNKLRAYQAGANLVLPKPVNINELLYIITNLIALKEDT